MNDEKERENKKADLTKDERERTEGREAENAGEETGDVERKCLTEGKEAKAKFFRRRGAAIAARVLLSVVILAGAFFGGFFVHKATIPEEINSLLWAKERIQSDYYEEISDEEFFDAVFFGVNSILDGYSGYLTKEEYEESRKKSAGEYSGLGLYFSSGEGLRVLRVAGGSPAEEAGIAEGSKIVAVGDDEENLTECETFEQFSALLSEYETEETFYLKEKAYPYGEDDCRIVQAKKANFVENYVFYRSAEAAYAYLGEGAEETAKGSVLSALPADTAYIRLTQFNGNAAAEFDAAMNRFRADGKKCLILDLRENGGGDMEILRSIAAYFCKGAKGNSPVAAKAVYKDGTEREFKAKGNYYEEFFGEDGKVYVLADEGSASASECLIGCMIDYGCIGYGEICLSYRGESAKTYGKGIMQTTRTRYLWGGEAIKLTTAKICWPLTGNCIHGRGVTVADGVKTAAENYATDGEIISAIGAFGI